MVRLLPGPARRALFLVALVTASNEAIAQQTDTLRDPFAHAETRTLSNGLKVFFVRTPGIPDAAVSVAVPYGFDQDPEGYRQLAHFAEHIMFSDRPGITELELKNAIENKGGSNNATTSADRTTFYARVRREQGLFALNWLSRVMTPPILTPSIVERERIPVSIEVRARQPGMLEWMANHVVDVPWLRPAGYWRREYDLPTDLERHDTDWIGLQAIDSAALRNFINRYYVPSRMTLTVVGDLPEDAVWHLIDTTFARLAPRPSPPALPAPRDPARARASYEWGFFSSVRLAHAYKRYVSTPRENLVTTFIEWYLSRRLNNRLRFASHKAVYGVSVYQQAHGRGSELRISARVKPAEVGYARAVIDSEIALLRDGTVPDSLFASERDVMTSTVRTTFNSAAAIDDFAMREMYSRDAYGEFPDILKEMASMQRNEVVTRARDLFARTREVQSVEETVPLSQATLLALAAVVIGTAIVVVRRLLVTPLPMASLRYVANIRRPPAYAALTTIVIAVVLIGLLRLGIYPIQMLYLNTIILIPSFAVQLFALLLMCMIPVVGFLLLRASIPSKVLVFKHGIAVKYAGYRSIYMSAADVAEVSELTLIDVYRRTGVRGLLRTRVMTPAISSPALFLKSATGRGWLFRSRDTGELLTVIKRYLA